MYYGHYNEDGKYLGFYTREIHGDNIPNQRIELTEQEWQEALTGDYKVIDGKHTYSPPPETTAEEIIEKQFATLDAEYQAQFSELAQALGLANLDNNTELITELQEEYAELKAAYQTEWEAIINGD